jgi:hypothetical protein
MVIFISAPSLCSAIGAPVTISIENKKFKEAIKIISKKYSYEIVLIGSYDTVTTKSLSIEGSNLYDALQTTLRSYGIKNKLLIYDKAKRKIEIFMPEYVTSNKKETIGKSNFRNFSEEDYNRIMAKDVDRTLYKELSKDDFIVLQKRSVQLEKFNDFSREDFDKLQKRGFSKINYKKFTDEDFGRLVVKSENKKEHRMFSDEDFKKLKNKKVSE